MGIYDDAYDRPTRPMQGNAEEVPMAADRTVNEILMELEEVAENLHSLTERKKRLNREFTTTMEKHAQRYSRINGEPTEGPEETSRY